jgi:protein-disulfide isomerase
VENPEILYAAIRAHPREFIALVNRAAQEAQAIQLQEAMRTDSARIRAEFLNPKVPHIEHRAILGNPNAAVTIVEYADFQCSYCARDRPVLVEIMRRYGDRVRLLVKHFPLDIHPHAMPAALVYEAVAREDPLAAYRYYDFVFAHQEELAAQGETFLEEAARRAGVNAARALRVSRSQTVREIVEGDITEAREFGFTGTPGFLINGVSLRGEQSLDGLERIIDRHLAATAPASR